jgi:putative peptidoglycan lipid II flippase
MFTVGAMTLLAKLGFVGRDLLVAWKFGRSSAFEAFLLAFVIPYTLTNALSDSLTATFLPDFIKLREQGRHEEARALYGELLAWLLLISGTVMFLCVAAQPLYVRLVAASFSAESWDMMFYLLCLTAPAAFLNCVVRFWQSILNAEDKFFIGSAVGVATPIISIALLFFSLNTGVFALSLGLLAGAIIELTMLGAALRRTNHFLIPRWRGFSLPVRDAFGQWWRLLLSVFFINSMVVVDNAMAARFAVHGSVAALNYGRKAVTFPVDLSAIAFVTVILPHFSKLAAARDWHSLRRTLRRYLSLIFAINLPIVVALVVWSKPIVRLLFERGEFSPADTEIVSRVLAYYAFTLPFYVAFLVLMKLLSSLRENVAAIWFAGVVLLSDVALNYVLSKRMGVSGIALATPCVYAIMSLVLYLHAAGLLKRRDSTDQK